MARPTKEGLDYINIDVDIFDDVKMMFVSDRFEEKGELITVKLLLFIYSSGYYVKWNDEVALLFAKRKFKNVSFGLVNDVVSELLKRDFFNEGIFKKFGILTSKGIQKRWLDVVQKSKRKCAINEVYSLLHEFPPQKMEETPSYKEETPSYDTLTTSEREETTQSKVKESKVKESIKNIKSWNQNPKAEDVGELPEHFLEKAKILIHQKNYYTPPDEVILNFWEVWKSTTLTGGKFYQTINDVYEHFVNVIKKETFKNPNNAHQQSNRQTTKSGNNGNSNYNTKA